MLKPAKYYKDRAVEAQTIADTMRDYYCRSVWQRIASGYENLGRYLEEQTEQIDAEVVRALKLTREGRVALESYANANEVQRLPKRR